MRPITANDPDGANEWRYQDLAELEPDLASRLVGDYGEIWLRESELPEDRRNEVGETLEILVADEWEDAESGGKRLRLRSWYTGETVWLYDWQGDAEQAVGWIRQQAELRAAWVRHERFLYGPTLWDPEYPKRRETHLTPDPEEFRAWARGDWQRHHG